MISLNSISKDEAARYMGINGTPDSSIEAMLDRCEKLVRETVRPNYVYREVDISFAEDGVHVEGMSSPLTGKSVRKHIEGCSKAVLMAVTLSAEADKLIRRAAISNMAESLAIDCLCSAAVEQACDIAEKEIFSEIVAPYRTWRFSPGYGDLPLDIQRDFLLFLNAQRRIGLTVTDNCLLIPSKSVTAIIGVSDKPVNKGAKGCAVCNMRESCEFRRTGKNCRNED